MDDVFIKTNEIFKRKKESITRLAPNESTFKGLSNDLRFYLVSLKIIGKISHSKVRLFFYPRGKILTSSLKLNRPWSDVDTSLVL